MDLFREWDADGDGEVSKGEFRKALQLLGLYAPRPTVDALFDEFDRDGGGSISFAELNKLLRRDVKAEAPRRAKAEEVVHVADVSSLRAEVLQGCFRALEEAERRWEGEVEGSGWARGRSSSSF